jgi:hypothetical protein
MMIDLVDQNNLKELLIQPVYEIYPGKTTPNYNYRLF